MMDLNTLPRISPTGGAAAVGAASSRPPPLDRPPRDTRTILLQCIIAPEGGAVPVIARKYTEPEKSSDHSITKYLAR